MQDNTGQPRSMRGAIIAIALATVWIVGLLVSRSADDGFDLRVLFDVLFAPISLLLIAAAIGLTIQARRSR